MNLSELKPAKGSRRPRRRIGRGEGSGQGCTAGKGNKGQKARSGKTLTPGFEGGQMPLRRRLQKFGFHNHFRKDVVIVNLRDLESFAAESVVDVDALKEKGMVGNRHNGPVKLLGQGELKKSLTIRLHACSKAASEAVTKAGGKVELLSTEKKAAE